MLEDIHDLAIVAERRVEQPISFAEMKKLHFILELERFW